MSDDEREDDGAGEGGAAIDTGLDEQGYHVVSNRGKFQNQMNPLQLKLQEEKRKAEEKRKEAEKKAKLAEKLKAFGGGKDEKKDDKEDGEKDKPKAGVVPEVQKGPLDSRMKEMMSAGIVSKAAGTGRGAALLSGRGRGGKAAGRGRGAAAGAGGGEGGGSPAGASAAAGSAGSTTTSTSDDSSDDDKPKKKKGSTPGSAGSGGGGSRMSLSRRSARMSLRDLGNMIGSALGLGGGGVHGGASAPTSPGSAGAGGVAESGIGVSASSNGSHDGSSGGSASSSGTGGSGASAVTPARQPSNSSLARLARASLTALGLASALRDGGNGGAASNNGSPASAPSSAGGGARESLSSPLSPALIEQGKQRAMELVANAQLQRATSQRLGPAPPLIPASPPDSGRSGEGEIDGEGPATSFTMAPGQREARASAVDERGQLDLRVLAASGKVKRWEDVWSATPNNNEDGAVPGSGEYSGASGGAVGFSSPAIATIPYLKLRSLVQEASQAAAKRMIALAEAEARGDVGDDNSAASFSADASALQLSPQLLASGVRDIELFSSTPESYLAEGDFVRFLEVPGGRSEWDGLPRWKQQSLRKKARLAVNVQALAMLQRQQQQQ